MKEANSQQKFDHSQATEPQIHSNPIYFNSVNSVKENVVKP